MAVPEPRHDLTRTTLAVLFVAGLLVATFAIVRPFVPAMIWAVTLVIATWPVMLRVQALAAGSRGAAVAVMTIGLLLLLIVPLWLAVSVVVGNIDELGRIIRIVLSLEIPPVPDWVAGIPIVGDWIAQTWQTVESAGVHELAPRLTPYAGTITRWIAASLGSIGEMFVDLLLTIGIAAVLYARGEAAARTALRFGRRLGGERGEMAAVLAGQAVRGVALGVVVTAVAQSALGGIGLAVTGVPFSALLTGAMFMLCLAQIGPAIVLIPAVVWLYAEVGTLWGSILVGFSVIVLTMDNFLRPVLIRKGAHLPILLILTGVIGGLLSLGLLGIFVGPTVLAVAYTLLNAWIGEAGEVEHVAPAQTLAAPGPMATLEISPPRGT